MKITGAVARAGARDFDLSALELREPKAHEVLVKMVATGLCHTDLIVRDQWFPTPLPAVLGHEGAGIVQSVGPAVTTVEAGDHVVLSYNSCGNCRNCRSAKPNYCGQFWDYNFSATVPGGEPTLTENGVVIGGNFFGQSSFATFAIASDRVLVRVNDDVPLEILGPLGCGIQTGAGAVLKTLRPHAAASIAVFGAGAVGLSAVMAAKLSGCTRILVVDKVESRLELALELGASDTWMAAGDNARDIRRATHGGVQFAIEATGVPRVLRNAMDSLAPGGTCALVGAAAARATAEIDISTLLFGRKLVGVIAGDAIPQVFVPELIDLYVNGLFPFTKLLTQYPHTDINVAISDAESGVSVKPVVLW